MSGEPDTGTPDLLGALEASLVPKPDRWSKMIADWQRRCDEAEARTRAAEARLAQIAESGSVEIHVDCEGCTENTAIVRALVEAEERLAQIAEISRGLSGPLTRLQRINDIARGEEPA